ncbi:MAG: GatB/YqeY domain-containing protein [Candidatus Omnitrophica bacterium]|nr:GatB/YqeY domain-containing protein [Candidatus Omnitrophota bacterium]
MGKLENKLADDLKGSIKSRDQVKTSTLRMVIASMQNLVIEKQVKELEDGDVLKIISKQVKQHLDSIESFKKAERQELVEKEAKELEILRSYLPEQLSPEKIEEIVKKAISETGASSKADFGKVIKHAMQELKGQADGKTVSAAVQKMLP